MSASNSKRRKLLIDCDPGVDDAVMLALALTAPELDIAAITTVAGNVPLSLTSRNARILTDLMQRRDVPVYAGCSAPLLRPPVTAEDFHGESGLHGIEVFEPTTPLQNEHAVTFLVRTLSKAKPKSISLLVTGPMTNIAAALALDPSIVAAVDTCIVMAGADAEGGNITEFAEFNVFADPHAAARVFQSELPIVVLSLDVTHTLRAEDERMSRLREITTETAKLVVRLLEAANTLEGRWKPGNRAPLHDPSTLIYLLRSDLFSALDVRVEVDASSGSSPTFGQTKLLSSAPNAKWVNSAKADHVFDFIVQRLKDAK